MSWFSQLTHTEGWTPDFIKKAGDLVAKPVVNAIPGGSFLNGILDLTNSRGNGPSPSQIVDQTYDNLQGEMRTASQFGALQGQGSALMQALFTPLGLVFVALVAWLLLRKK